MKPNPVIEPSRSSDAGFSLFESLVALAIFSMAAIATLTLVSQNLRSSSIMEARTFASFVAENVLVETYILERVVLGEETGEAQMGGYDFEWRRDITETGEGNLQAVTVRVTLDGVDQTLVIRHGFRRG